MTFAGFIHVNTVTYLVYFFSLTFMFGNCVAIVVAMFYNMSSLGWNGTLAALLGSIFTYVVGELFGAMSMFVFGTFSKV